MKSSIVKIIATLFIMNLFLMNCTIAPAFAENDIMLAESEENMDSGDEYAGEDQQYTEEDQYADDEQYTEEEPYAEDEMYPEENTEAEEY